jgi:zinc D-Ala-D-Ala carboxypeptidase
MTEHDLPEHFTIDELSCRCGCKGIQFKPHFLKALGRLRTALGEPMVITSGYRCPAYNKKIKGSQNSQHTLGLAVDVGITDSQKRHRLIQCALALGFKGIGVDGAFVHLDLREGEPVFYLY